MDDDLLPFPFPFPEPLCATEERRESSMSTGANEMRRTLERRDRGATNESRWFVLENL